MLPIGLSAAIQKPSAIQKPCQISPSRQRSSVATLERLFRCPTGRVKLWRLRGCAPWRDWKEGGSEVGALLPGGSYGRGEFVWLWVDDRRAVVGVGVAAAAGAGVSAV